MDDDFSGVEISITGGVEEIVRGSNHYDFFFFLNHIFIVYTIQDIAWILSIWPEQNRKSNNNLQKK